MLMRSDEEAAWINHSKQSHFIWLNGFEWKSCLHSMTRHNLSVWWDVYANTMHQLGSRIGVLHSVYESFIQYIKRLNQWQAHWRTGDSVVCYFNHLQDVCLTLIHRLQSCSLSTNPLLPSLTAQEAAQWDIPDWIMQLPSPQPSTFPLKWSDSSN